MGILSTNKKIINLGQVYSAGSGISIDDYVISYTGNEGQWYNAGPNIDIYDDQDQLYISGKDWSADIVNASSNAYEQATALIPPEFDPSYISGVVDSKLDSTAFSTVSGDYATTSYVDMSDDLTYSRATAWGNQNLAPLNSVADNSAKWNEIEVYEQNSATYLTAHQDISNKLDTTAFSTVSGTFLTAHQVIPSAKWEDASDVVQSNSAQWSENIGDEEVNNAVYNNSAKWNDISVYQTNSANYLTAHQDLSYISGQVDNKLDTTAFSTVSGTFLTAHQDISNKLDTTAFSTVSGNFLTAVDLTPYYTTADANTLSSMLSGAIDYVSANAGDEFPASANEAITAYQNASGTYLTAHQPISANEWNNVYETVETNSGSWAGGGGGSVDTVPVAVISPLVTGFSGESAYLGIESTALNLSSYVPVSSIGYNYSYISTISGNSISAHTARYANFAIDASYAQRCLTDSKDNTITSYYQPKLTISGDAGTITSINGSAVGASIPEGWELVGSAGISIVDDADNNQTIISVTGGGAGGDTEVNDYVYNNSATIDNINSVVQSRSGVWNSAAYDVNKIQYYSALWDDTYSTVQVNSANWGGNPEVESYVQTNSASIDDAVSTYQTNSGTFLTAVNIPESANWNDATTAYQNNSASYLTEPNLEYNAVNEISGYNGSAIAQYGAEKQWLVHDDTLVHAANSAQYALGVNLSAVAQLLGVDRTLLWSGSKGSVSDTMDLSEPISSFNKVEFIMNEGNPTIPLHSFISNTDGTLLYPYYIRTNRNNAELCYLWSLNRLNNDTRLSVAISVSRTNGGTTGDNATKFNEIWGIGRKA